MSKRFGRNQKRKLNEQLKQANERPEYTVTSEHGNLLQFGWNDSGVEQLANAHLISAAPDLYEILREFVNNSSCQTNHPDLCERAEAVLDKAEGKQNEE